MAESGIYWSGTSGHMQVGLNIIWEDIGINTTASHVWVDFYVRSVNWGYNDGQAINFQHSIGGSWGYTMSAPSGSTTTQYLGRYDIGVHGTSYGGGPYWTFGAYISGAYDGSSPSIDVGFSLPARPSTTPSPPPIGVDSVTSTSARIVVWPAEGNGAGVDAYQVLVGTNGNDIIGSQVANFAGGTGTAHGLNPAQSYGAIARAHNANGWSSWAGPIYFTTGATTPAMIPAPALSAVTQTSVQMNWNPPNNGGSAITNYGIQVATDSGFTQNLWNLNDPTSPASIETLTPGTEYWFRVRAINGVGPGPWSPASKTTTLAGTPVILSPANNQLAGASNGFPFVTLQALGIAAGRTITAEWSKSSTFASGIKTVTLSPANKSANDQYTLQDINQYLDNGTWYLRAKVTNTASGYVTPWSTVVAVTHAHTPSASVIGPTAGEIVKYQASTLYRWNFNDQATNDAQTAYRLVIENNATGAVLYDSNKVMSSSKSVAVALPTTVKAVTLRWRVMVWDRGDQASAWTGYALFTLADPPVVTTISPAPALAVDNGSPTFKWTVSIPSGGTIATSTVVVMDATSNEIVWQQTVTGNITEVTPPVVILSNLKSYYFTIDVTDTAGLKGTTSGVFETEYQAPDSIVYRIVANQQDDLGYIQVAWPDANPDPLFVHWKVYRRLELGQWELISTIGNQNTRFYNDYMLTAGDVYSYSVTQVATRSGVLLESPVGYYLVGTEEIIESRYFAVDLSYYWIINPDNPDLSLRLDNVVSDDSELEFESETYTIIGRGRHRDYGDALGYAGSLQVQVRTTERPSSFRKKVEELRRAQETYYLRTPFGRLFQVALGNIGWSPLPGTGKSEMGDMTIPYEQVG